MTRWPRCGGRPTTETSSAASDVLAVGGDSAGGNLAAVAAQALPDLLDAQVLICPPTHMLGDYPSRTDNAKGYFLEWATCEWFAAHYAGSADDLDDPRLAPYLGTVRATPRRSWSPPSSTRCATRVRRTPTRLRGGRCPRRHRAVRRAGARLHHMGLMSPAAGSALADTVARIRKLLHR